MAPPAKALKSLPFILALLWLVPGAAAAHMHTPSAERHQTLIFGRITSDPADVYPRLMPLVEYAASKLRHVGIEHADIAFASSVEEMERLLQNGGIDWVGESPYKAVLMKERAKAEYLVSTRRNGDKGYKSLIFVRADSPVSSLSDLRGRKIAFEHKTSTSAFVLPADAMLSRGFLLEPLANVRMTPAAEAIGFVFARTENNIVSWVSLGFVDAGVLSSSDWRSAPFWRKGEHASGSLADEMKIIHETAEAPRALEIVRRDLDPAVKSALRTVLLGAHKDPAAADALGLYFRTSQFDPVSPETKARLEEIADTQTRLATLDGS